MHYPHFLASLACNSVFFAAGWMAFARFRPRVSVALIGAVLCAALVAGVCLVLKEEIRSALLAGKDSPDLLPRLVLWQEITMYSGGMVTVVFIGWALLRMSQR
jgi:hypothetical protein